jgi:hypothetical protein
MDPALSLSLAVFGVCFALAAAAPAPRRAIPGEHIAYVTLLGAGALTFGAAVVMPLMGMWVEGAVGVVSATSLLLVCMWLARSPLRGDGQDDEDEDTGGGGRRRPPEPPRPWGPSGDVAPQGPSLDWSSFDDQRAVWERPAADRDLVGV